MNEEREHQIQRFKRLIDDGEIYEALRGSLALRPPPSELIGLIRRKLALASDSLAPPDKAFIREAASRFLGPSHRALDPNHPVGAVAAAIRKALPDFQEWRLDAGEAAARFLALQSEHRDALRATLPPGFSEGRPGAFLRATRALVHVGGGGTVRGMYQLLQDRPDEAAFRAAASGIRISDVIDLTWMAAGLIELRSVQEVLERMAFAVLPGEQVRFSTYDEPRYRSALQLQVEGISVRFACGGVLAEWSGRPQGIDAAHIRIFLEPWAAVQTGQVVDLDNFPEMSPTEVR